MACSAVRLVVQMDIQVTCVNVIVHAGASGDTGQMFSLHDEIRTSVVVGTYASLNENVQVNGIVFITDMTGYTMKHMTRWKMEDIKKWSSMWQASPGSLREQSGTFSSLYDYTNALV
jgi:CRAL/TRIO domain